jgi:hypothetical protein
MIIEVCDHEKSANVPAKSQNFQSIYITHQGAALGCQSTNYKGWQLPHNLPVCLIVEFMSQGRKQT